MKCVFAILFCVFSLSAFGEVYEDFDGLTPTNLPSGWSDLEVSGLSSWISTNIVDSQSSPNVVRLSSGASETNEVWLVSTNMTVGTNFVAQFYLRNADTNGFASLSLVASTNGSGSATNDFTVVITNGIAVSTNWSSLSLNARDDVGLASLVGTGTVYFAFAGVSSGGSLLDVDTVLLARGLVPDQFERFADGLGAGWRSEDVNQPTSLVPEWRGTNNWHGRPAVYYNSSELQNLNLQSARLSHRNYLDSAGSVNMRLNFSMYQYPADTHSYNVTLQPQYSLDNGPWQSAGDSFKRDTGLQEGWFTNQVVVTDTNFPNASSIRTAFFASHKGIAETNLYLSDVKVEFLTLVGFDEPVVSPTNPVYGDMIDIRVDIEKLPASDVTMTNAEPVALFYRQSGSTGSFTRVSMTNELGNTWKTQSQLGPYEAGVVLEYYLEVEYESATGRSTYSPQRYPTAENSYASVTNGGLGSVWINEVFYNTAASNQFVEIAGPAGRPAIQDWSLDVLDLAGSNVVASYLISTNFADESNGYGFYLLGGSNVSNHAVALTNALPSDAGGLRLVNSDGVVEHAIAYGSTNSYQGYTNAGSSSAGDSLSFVGYGAYATNLWEGYYSSFSWTNAAPSPSAVTNGQGFLLEPMQTTISGRIYDNQSDPTNGVAYATVIVDLFLQDGTQVLSSNLVADTNGQFTCTFAGFNNDATNGLDCMVTAIGFGYVQGARTAKVSIATSAITNHVSLGLFSGSAIDFFSGSGLAGYWDSQEVTYPGGGMPYWGWLSNSGVDGDPGVAVYFSDNASRLSTYKYRLTHGNALNTQGASVLNVEYWMKHTDESYNCTVQAQFHTNTVYNDSWQNLGSTVSRNDTQWAGQWRRHRFSLASDYFSTNQAIHVGFLASQYYRSSNVLFDDLRVTFGSDVLLSDLAHAPLAPRFDEELDLRFGLSPVGAGISNVTVDVVWSNSVSGGGWQTNAVESVRYRASGSSDAWSLTNLPLSVLTTNLEFEILEAIPAQSADSQLSYYVRVEFKGPGADSIGDGGVKYLPDNATYADGLTSLHGDYLPDPESVGIQAVAPVWINEIYYHTAASNQFVELAGAEAHDLTGWTLEVLDLDTQTSTNYALGSLGLTNGVTNNIGFLVLGGSAVTEVDMALSASLPVSGGLLLYDAEASVMDSVSYGMAPAFGFTYGGEAGTNDSVVAWGLGNPAHQRFAWTNTTDQTPNQINAEQNMLNAGPLPSPAEFADQWIVGVTSVYVEAVSARSMFAPVEYRIWIDGGYDGGWSTNGWHTFSNRVENTEYTFLTQARDAVGATNGISVPVTYYTLMDTPEAPVAVGVHPTSLTVSNQVPNVGASQTAIRISGTAGDSGWDADGVYAFGGLTPNTAYDLSAQGRNGDGIETQSGPTSTLYTAANVPTAMPILDHNGGYITLSLTNAYNVSTGEPLDGNPTNTVYTIGTYGDEGVTNYLTASGAITNKSAASWLPLPAWHAPGTPLQTEIPINGTNGFFLVARNDAGLETELGPIVEIPFNLGVSVNQVIHVGDGLGHVSADVFISNPLTNVCLISVYYSDTGISGPWHTATVTSASAVYGSPTVDNGFMTTGLVYQIQGMDTSVNGTNTATVVWDARADLGNVDNTNVWLRWTVLDGVDGLHTESYSGVGLLDLSYPEVDVLSCLASNPTRDDPISFNLTFSEPVSGLTSNSILVSEGSLSAPPVPMGGAPSTNWTFGVRPASNEVSVAVTSVVSGAVQDIYGNASLVWSGSVAVFHDSVDPVLSGLTASPSPVKAGESVDIEFDVSDISPITNAYVSVNGRDATLATETNNHYTFTYTVVTNDGDGLAAIIVRADDAAGNESSITNATLLVTDQSPSILVFGADATAVGENTQPSLLSGTDFGHRDVSVTITNHFTVTNNWRESVAVTNWTLSGFGSNAFDVVAVPGALAPDGGSAFLSVEFAPPSVGDYQAVLTLQYSGPDGAFRISLAGSAFLTTPQDGPFHGGNAVTITNGYFGTITNVLVDGIDVVDLIGSGTNWVQLVMPAATNAGLADVVIQTSDNDDMVLHGAYTYNPAGVISNVSPASGSWTGAYEVVISGMNLGDGADVTNVVLCDVSAASIESQSATQIVVTADSSLSARVGNVQVFSTSFGETVATNGFEYSRMVQAPLTFETQSPQVYLTAQALLATGGTGTGSVSYAVLSGPGSIAGSNLLVATSGTGTIDVMATKAQDALYYANAVTSTVEAAKATPTATLIVTNSPISYDGQDHEAAVVISGSSVPGAISNILAGGLAMQRSVGLYEVTADFVPDDIGNYAVLIGQIAGTFEIAESYVTNAPIAVPQSWLFQYGLTNDMASLVNVYHPEFGATTWQIYVMDANPTSGVGVLRLNLEQSNVTQRIGWYVSSNRVYSLFGSTNLNAGITNLLYGPFQPPQSGVWVYDDSDDAGSGFYRVRVELP